MLLFVVVVCRRRRRKKIKSFEQVCGIYLIADRPADAKYYTTKATMGNATELEFHSGYQ